MSYRRTPVRIFQLGNPLYANSIISFFAIDGTGAPTTALIPLYVGPTGTPQAANPQTLDSGGKLVSAIWFDQPYVAKVGNAAVPNHQTAPMYPDPGGFQGDWLTGTTYNPGDEVRDPSNGNLYVALMTHTAGPTLAADVAAGKWLLFADVSAIVASQIAAAASAGTAMTQAGIATTQSGIATTQSGVATTQAGIATVQAGIASAQAGNAAASAAAALLANPANAIIPGAPPTIAVAPVLNRLPAPLAIARASTATYLGPDGLLKTAAAGAARIAWDKSQSILGLLVEQAASNLHFPSEDLSSGFSDEGTTRIANATMAPDGSATAFKIAEDNTNAWHRINSTNVLGNLTTNLTTVSVFVKAAERSHGFAEFYNGNGTFAGRIRFDLALATATVVSGATSAAIEPYPNGWYRVSAVFTPTAGGSSGRIDLGLQPVAQVPAQYIGTAGSGLYYWGLQMETGPFATSYIKTVAAAASRAADLITLPLTSGANLNPNGGTLLVEWSDISRIMPAGAIGLVALSDGSNANSIVAFRNANANYGVAVTSASVQQFQALAGAVAMTAQRIAFAWAAADFSMSLNGAAPSTQASGSLPSGLTTLTIGAYPAGAQFGAYIRRIFYAPSRLTNAVLQQLSDMARGLDLWDGVIIGTPGDMIGIASSVPNTAVVFTASDGKHIGQGPLLTPDRLHFNGFRGSFLR